MKTKIYLITKRFNANIFYTIIYKAYGENIISKKDILILFKDIKDKKTFNNVLNNMIGEEIIIKIGDNYKINKNTKSYFIYEEEINFNDEDLKLKYFYYLIKTYVKTNNLRLRKIYSSSHNEEFNDSTVEREITKDMYNILDYYDSVSINKLTILTELSDKWVFKLLKEIKNRGWVQLMNRAKSLEYTKFFMNRMNVSDLLEIEEGEEDLLETIITEKDYYCSNIKIIRSYKNIEIGKHMLPMGLEIKFKIGESVN
jgi:hypothetical protein